MTHGRILRVLWRCKQIFVFLCMTVLELRAEIHKAIDNAPEILLPQILENIIAIQQPSANREDITKFIDKIFKEDDNLLRRLAE